MSQSHQQHRTTNRRLSVSTAVGIAAERAALAARERDLEQARAAARRLSVVSPVTAR